MLLLRSLDRCRTLFYIDVSVDTGPRLIQHNLGESRWTSQFSSVGEARRHEALLKAQKGRGRFFLRTGLARVASAARWLIIPQVQGLGLVPAPGGS